MTTNGTRRAGWRGFGVAGALPHDVIRTLAAAAEAAGYHTFWVNDTPHGDGLASLRAAAEVTSEILLGVGVIPLDRQPADVIARRVDELGLPQQRLIVGIGSGNPKAGWHGSRRARRRWRSGSRRRSSSVRSAPTCAPWQAGARTGCS